jgi:hypothetical protein
MADVCVPVVDHELHAIRGDRPDRYADQAEIAGVVGLGQSLRRYGISTFRGVPARVNRR